MSDTDWHVPADTLEAYLGGSSNHVALASVEAHLLACPACRMTLARIRMPDSRGGSRAEVVWEHIEARLDQPRVPDVPGVLWVRTTLASPPLRRVTAALVLALAIIPAAIAQLSPRGGVTLMVALAPLAPLLGAALAFRTESDPAGSMAEATPLATGRLTLQRAAVVATLSLLAGVVGSALATMPVPLLAAWFLPGVVLCTAVGAASTLIDPLRVAATLGVVWLGGSAIWSLRTRSLPIDVAVAELPTTTAATQFALLLTGCLCAAIWWVRRDECPAWRRT
jgi:hypothetical protein